MPAPTPRAAPFMKSRLFISPLLVYQGKCRTAPRQQGHKAEVADNAGYYADNDAWQHVWAPAAVFLKMPAFRSKVLGCLELALPAWPAVHKPPVDKPDVDEPDGGNHGELLRMREALLRAQHKMGILVVDAVESYAKDCHKA